MDPVCLKGKLFHKNGAKPRSVWYINFNKIG